MQVTAHLSSIRIAPRKVRLVANLLKGADAIAAKGQLRYLPKRSSKPLEKLLESALAHAQNNLGLVRENMRIKEIMVNGGPVLKRFEPKGFGSVSPQAKRTSHITIILEEKIPGLKGEEKASEAKSRTEARSASGTGMPKHEVKKELGKRDSGVKSTKRKLFQRK